MVYISVCIVQVRSWTSALREKMNERVFEVSESLPLKGKNFQALPTRAINSFMLWLQSWLLTQPCLNGATLSQLQAPPMNVVLVNSIVTWGPGSPALFQCGT